MSLFQRIHEEKNELIHFETLITEIASQEKITFSEACGVIVREAEEHISEIPFSLYEPFYLYKYNVADGFIRGQDFSEQSLAFLRSMAEGEEYEELQENKGVYRRLDGGHGWGNGWYYEFYFKGRELAVSFMDAEVKLPPCIEKFESFAKNKLRRKAEKQANKLKSEASGVVSTEMLLGEIQQLKNKIIALSEKVPILLGELREDDPLLLAIQIRNSEWAKYDPDNDRPTRGSQAAITQELEGKGFNKRQAEAIELVACPIKR